MKITNFLLLITLLCNDNFLVSMFIYKESENAREIPNQPGSLEKLCLFKIIEESVNGKNLQLFLNQLSKKNNAPTFLRKTFKDLITIFHATPLLPHYSPALIERINEVRKAIALSFFDLDEELHHHLLLAIPYFFEQKKLLGIFSNGYKLTNSKDIESIYQAILLIITILIQATPNKYLANDKIICDKAVIDLLMLYLKNAIEHNLIQIFNLMMPTLLLLPRHNQLLLFEQAYFSNNIIIFEPLKKIIKITESESYLLLEKMLYSDEI